VDVNFAVKPFVWQFELDQDVTEIHVDPTLSLLNHWTGNLN